MLLDKEFWNNRYLHNQTGWDAGTATPPLKEYIDSIENKDLRILIPGCGNAHEAAYLLQQGFTAITLIDISPIAVEAVSIKFKDHIGKVLTVICGDFFELDKTFDLILEQTFFCAIHPSQRNEYVNKMAELLNPGGKLAGVFFDREFEGGPPFSGSREEYEKLFAEKFVIQHMEPCNNSIPPRAGSELFIELQTTIPFPDKGA